MRTGELSASMMCADPDLIPGTLAVFEQEGVEHLHIDVMDGKFVNNRGYGPSYVKRLRKLTGISLDLHIMMEEPERHYEEFEIRPNDLVSIHCESTRYLTEILRDLKRFGCRRMAAVSPGTPLAVLDRYLDDIDGINLLMVYPGFAGQPRVPGMLKKAMELRRYLRERDREDLLMEVDGNITRESGAVLRGYGAELFVAGSSSIFRGGPDGYAENIRALRQAIL